MRGSVKAITAALDLVAVVTQKDLLNPAECIPAHNENGRRYFIRIEQEDSNGDVTITGWMTSVLDDDSGQYRASFIGSDELDDLTVAKLERRLL